MILGIITVISVFSTVISISSGGTSKSESVSSGMNGN
jgi:hypothetical protein